ncbi:hypothetical protein CC78DRAFT_616242 [Lojkania enalia]|uniref:EthD domain-containing protein n=1 Tax=Lojkania enalia TaxID=147567 RepID=A0A9P4KAL6_9PLEO|nr:hypothetical protein CC78DRAFT_616242 [Didymosphaeria enalia]
MAPGIIWVSSRIVDPALTPKEFCTWYENTHIPEVTALPGVPRAERYEAMAIPSPSSESQKFLSDNAPWLTVYSMPDIEYRNTSAFRGLDGQSEPEESLLENVFRHARFDTRFYEEMQVFEPAGPPVRPATLLISAALQPAVGTDADFEAWYRQEHLRALSECSGFRRTRRYRLVSGTSLDRFVRTSPEIPGYLALHEFQGEDFPWGELSGTAGTEWAKRVMGGLKMEEIGWFRLKRTYPE